MQTFTKKPHSVPSCSSCILALPQSTLPPGTSTDTEVVPRLVQHLLLISAQWQRIARSCWPCHILLMSLAGSQISSVRVWFVNRKCPNPQPSLGLAYEVKRWPRDPVSAKQTAPIRLIHEFVMCIETVTKQHPHCYMQISVYLLPWDADNTNICIVICLHF